MKKHTLVFLNLLAEIVDSSKGFILSGDILNTVCPINSGVAQRKRVGLITQRSKDRNLPPLYQSRAKSANEKRF